MANCFTDTINSTDFIGDSLDKINANFLALKTVSCELSGYLNGVTSFGVNSVNSGINATVSSIGNNFTIVENTTPIWYVGSTRLPLNTETVGNRVSECKTKSSKLLKSVQDTVNSNVILERCTTYVAQTTAAFPGNGAFNGGINLIDGRVFLPRTSNATSSYIYDYYTESVLHLNSFPVTVAGGFWGSVLMSDGRVFCVPHNSTSAVIYTPYEVQTGSMFTTNAGGTYPGSQAYLGGTLLSDGRVLLSPYNTNSVAIYDPVSNTKTSIPITTGTGAVYSLKSIYGCCSTYNGKVFFVPNNTSTYWVLNAANTTMVAVDNTAPGGDAFRGAVTLSDGKIFCVPYNSLYSVIYDPATDSVTNTSVIFPGSGAYETGVLLPDGRVFLAPNNATNPAIYNPFNDTLELVEVNVTPGMYYGCVLTVNNKILLCPRDSTSGMLISVPCTNGFSRTLYTNPLFNKL